MAIQRDTYTIEQYLAIALQPENADIRLELVGGQMIELPPATRLSVYTAAQVAYLVGDFAEQHQSGYVFAGNALFELGAATVRLPDAAFIAFPYAFDETRYTIPTPPDLAIEVIAPGDSAEYIIDKLTNYLEAGARLVWLIYPMLKIVMSFTPSQGQFLMEGDTLDGGDVLPGFAVPVRELFPK